MAPQVNEAPIDNTQQAKANDTRLPVTLLSGFLGSGKTTLLEHILRSKDHGMKCAVIVNDMAALNIDANLIENHHVVQKQEQVVRMQNGCICCTLRQDLLEEVAQLAKSGEVDYLVIESTGISEPMQVAETFTTEFLQELIDGQQQQQQEEEGEEKEKSAEMNQAGDEGAKLAKLLADGGVHKLARLDTCVTVLDCLNFFASFETGEFLRDRFGQDVTPEDDRTITDLMVDQIEFANVILLNKVDLVDARTLAEIHGLIKRLNPVAKVHETRYSKVPLSAIINTGLFDFEVASTSAGWLQSIHEMTLQKNGKMAPTPETEEYGIGNFIYVRRRPFHPTRLMELVNDKFFLIQPVFSDDDGEEEDYDDEEDGEGSADDMSEDEQSSAEEDDEEDDDCDEQAEIQARVTAKKQCPMFGPLLRSKGFLWLATKPRHYGEWSQAGCMLTVGRGSAWFAATPEEEWGIEDEYARKSIRADFEGQWGDRRQELVFIGTKMDRQLIEDALDACLLTDDEWNQWVDIMGKSLEPEEQQAELEQAFEDPWEAWPVADAADEDEGEYEDDDEEAGEQ